MNVFDNAKYIKARISAESFSFHDPIPFFRREFTVKREDVENARLFIQAPGFAEVYINGKSVTDEIFFSPISDFEKILWYNSFDVTDLLDDGINTLGVIVGNGFFNESFFTGWKFNLAKWRDAPQFMLCLKINGKTALVSDNTWQASRASSHIIFSHLRSGEYVDMRKLDNSWMYSGYEAKKWISAIERDPEEITGVLKPMECQPVKECEVLTPIDVKKTDKGWLIDFGKNSSGYMEITLEAPRGQEIIFRYCEDLNEDLTPKHNKMEEPYREEIFEFQVNKLIASGGRDTFKPKFSYHGFRYVIIEGLPCEPRREDMRAYFIHNDVKRKADFTSGSDIINFIYTAGIRSSYSNMFWSITDCPTREKLGWTNDAQASTEQMLINFDIVPLFKKWFSDILADQSEEGELHGIIPSAGWGYGWGPVCDYFLFELPSRVYLYTGDASMLTEALPNFERYKSFLKKAFADNHEFTLGDWLGGGNSKVIPREFIQSVYMLKVLKTLMDTKKLAKVSYSDTENEYKLFLSEFKKKYIDEDGRCTIDEQTSCAMLIVLGIYDEKEVICRQLADAVLRDGITLTSGMVGVQYLYDALSECGRPDLAYRIITESEPGYKTWYKSGATTLWEKWNGTDFGSHNHHMFSNVLAWFFKSLLGIAPCEDAPAFKKIKVNPQFIPELGFAKGYEDTVMGRIEAEWRYENGGFTYKIKLPEGVAGEYLGRELLSGENTFFIPENK